MTEAVGTTKNDLEVGKCVLSREFDKAVEKLPEKYKEAGKKLAEQSGGPIERTSKALAKEVFKDESPGVMTDIKTGILECCVQAKVSGDNDYSALKCVATKVIDGYKSRGVSSGEGYESAEFVKRQIDKDTVWSNGHEATANRSIKLATTKK